MLDLVLAFFLRVNGERIKRSTKLVSSNWHFPKYASFEQWEKGAL
jgi:hypothetical protein